MATLSQMGRLRLCSALAAAALLLLAACTTPPAARTPPLAAAAGARGVVMLVRPSLIDGGQVYRIYARVGTDIAFVGTNRGGEYVAIRLPPGRHTVCTDGGDRVRILWHGESCAQVTVTPDTVRYLLHTARHAQGNWVVIVDDADGRQAMEGLEPGFVSEAFK